eukprot:COSAG06_NODE_1078_length_10799_cov_118.610748_3_plen_81_part_00
MLGVAPEKKFKVDHEEMGKVRVCFCLHSLRHESRPAHCLAAAHYAARSRRSHRPTGVERSSGRAHAPVWSLFAPLPGTRC